MKKTTKKPSTKLIVDEFDKFCKQAEESKLKKVTDNKKCDNYRRFIEEELPQQSTKIYNRILPESIKRREKQKYCEPNVKNRIWQILYQNMYQMMSEQEEDKYNMVHQRKRPQKAQHKRQIKPCKQPNKKGEIINRRQVIPDRDYFPEEIYKPSDVQSESMLKQKRPMSALLKKYQMQPKLQKIQKEKQKIIKKTLSTSKFKEQQRPANYSQHKQKTEQPSIYKKNIQLIKNNVPLKKQPNNPYQEAISSNLKKKTVINKPLKIQQTKKGSFNQSSMKKFNSQEIANLIYFPQEEEKTQIKLKQKPSMKKQEEKREDLNPAHKNQRKIYKQEKKRQRQPSQSSQTYTKQLKFNKPIIKQDLFQEVSQQQRDRLYSRRRRQPISQHQQLNRRNQQTEQIRQRRQHRRERQPQPRQQPSNRNPPNPRRQARPRQPRVRQQPRRPQPNRTNRNNPRFQSSTDRRSPNPGSIFRLVSQTINGQLEFINNQFNMMSNIFENISNYVNINIDTRPNLFSYNSNQNIESSDDYDTETSESYSSNYDDYYEDQSQAEGMGEDQLQMIGKIKYKISEHGNNQCTICLLELKNGQDAKKLFCDHVFHSDCIDEWLRRKSDCPVCRDKQAVQ